ncbi:DUF6288 domain-containing protein [Haloferula rosea]|uniref:Discoidin domain-containing protein n=1 Tax=Haloferula rosea TaxID=490093 RepID=A0A934RBW0_9BACT|nr:DUF6288 domain-containing protein [Haloferula rosea]MBK1825615.1 discoidin domain-containing protein [Haloferula rosea]
MGAWLPVGATPLEVKPLSVERGWFLPGGESGAALAPGESVVGDVEVPELSEKEAGLPGAWRGVLALDVYGTSGNGSGRVKLEAIDPASGEAFAKAEAEVSGPAPRAVWAAIASSAQGGSDVSKVFDRNPKTDWHSRYGKDQPKPPHWIGVEFGQATVIEGVRYLPRQGGFTNGVAKDYRVEVRRAGRADWEVMEEGTSDRVSVADKRGPIEVRFEKPMAVEAFRFVVVSDWSGGGFGTAAELEAIGLKLPEREETVEASERAWLEVPAELLESLTGKRFGLRVVSAGGATVVVGTPRWCRIHEAPTGKLFGRSNGGLGPDKLGAGLLGFDGMTEHKQTVLSVMKVREGGPAAKAGLVVGDAIVSASGSPLPVNDLNPGWEWFQRSHEAVLGRATEAVLAAGGTTLDLGVLRDGKVQTLKVKLPRMKAFTTMNPETDPVAAELLEDSLNWVRENQRPDGSWSGDMKRTTFAGLALLATGEKRDVEQVKRAIDWGLEKFPSPEKHGNLGFWAGSYMGILYSEWYLRTEDDRVLAHLELMRDWAYEGQHNCKWDVPALGHGPSGLPYGEKALVAPACHLLVFEALAQRCGMESKLWELLMPYMEMSWSDPKEGGHGAMGYNRSYKDLGEFWSRSGLFATAAHLRGERQDMEKSMTKIMVERHSWFRNSHAYGEPGGGLGLLALNLCDPENYSKVIKDYAWWFSLAWEPDYGLRFTTPHMGAPYMGEDDLMNVVYALVLQGPKQSLHLTGKTSKP